MGYTIKEKTKKYGDRTSPGCREGKRRNVSLPLRDAAHRPNARRCASASAATTNSSSWVLQRAAAHKLHCPSASPVATKNVDESGVSTCPKVQTSRTPLNSPLVRIVQALSFSLDRDKSRLRCAVPCSVRAPHTEPPIWLALRRRYHAHATRYQQNHQLVQEFPGSRVHAGLSLCPSVVVQVKTACPDSPKTTEGQATDQAEQQQQSRQWLRTAGPSATGECGEVDLWGRARVKFFFFFQKMDTY